MAAEKESEGKMQLAGKELLTKAQQMVESNDPVEVESLKEELTRAFYGEKPSPHLK